MHDLKKDNASLKDQVSQADKSNEKLRKHRTEYKTAWEESEAKLQKKEQEWKNKKYEFKE